MKRRHQCSGDCSEWKHEFVRFEECYQHPSTDTNRVTCSDSYRHYRLTIISLRNHLFSTKIATFLFLLTFSVAYKEFLAWKMKSWVRSLIFTLLNLLLWMWLRCLWEDFFTAHPSPKFYSLKWFCLSARLICCAKIYHTHVDNKASRHIAVRKQKVKFNQYMDTTTAYCITVQGFPGITTLFLWI